MIDRIKTMPLTDGVDEQISQVIKNIEIECITQVEQETAKNSDDGKSDPNSTKFIDG